MMLAEGLERAQLVFRTDDDTSVPKTNVHGL
jgi:hypothetical protein